MKKVEKWCAKCGRRVDLRKKYACKISEELAGVAFNVHNPEYFFLCGECHNRRMAEAAPELLAALKECLYELDMLTSCSPEDSPAMIQARAAIAKAEGR